MSLKGVHLVLISASTLLSLAFAFWCLQQYRLTEDLGVLVGGVASLLCGLGLAGYATWFARDSMRRLP